MRLIPKEEQFFDLFEQQAANALQGARSLHRMLEQYTTLDSAYVASKEIHELEHHGDDLVAECVARLNKSFITPFDREDIYALTRALDDVLDWVDSSAERMVILKIEKPTPFAIELSRLVIRGAEEIANGVHLLRNLRDAEPLLRLCNRINKLENDADQVLREALGSLFADHQVAPLEVIKWKDVYENLEMATDKCQEVANILHTVLAKYV
jgi:hypothetical protein